MNTYYSKDIMITDNLGYNQMIDLLKEQEDYCLYENNGDISIGIGNHIDIKVSSTTIEMTLDGNSKQFNATDLCNDLEKVLRNIELEGWRLYGISNFALARFTYGLPIGNEYDELMHLFIPSKEYRISDNKITLRALHEKDIEVMEEQLKQSIDCNSSTEIKFLNPDKVTNYDEDYYKKIVDEGVAEIREDKYQKIILSRKVPIESRLNMSQTYIKGRSVNTPARSYICRIGDLEVVGFSPETVAEVDADRTVYTFPLAGTRALTKSDDINKKLRAELVNDTKEIAEHAISVKLADEELQQICEEKSVVVTEFMSVMERGTVQHLGSRLRGKLKDELTPWHALCKLFPAVTASGIPKREAIEAIGRIEKEVRDLYSGSVLIYDYDGMLDAALVLRTIFQTANETWTRVGAGIVNMSNSEREFIETQEKVSSIAKTLVIEE